MIRATPLASKRLRQVLAQEQRRLQGLGSYTRRAACDEENLILAEEREMADDR